MAVRVRVKIELAGKTIECVAIANSGYEAEEPEIVLPLSLVRNVVEKRTMRAVKYTVAGGREERFWFAGNAKVKVVCQDRMSAEIPANLIVAKGESQASLNDSFLGTAGIVIQDARRGTWRFQDDASGIDRASESRTLY
jgi:hypothetical protein